MCCIFRPLADRRYINILEASFCPTFVFCKMLHTQIVFLQTDLVVELLCCVCSYMHLGHVICHVKTEMVYHALPHKLHVCW